MKKFIALIGVLLIFASASFAADVYVKQTTHTDEFSMMGQSQPAKDDINEMWIGKDKFAMVSSETTIIINLDDKKMYMINHSTKTYVPMDLPLDISQYFPAQFSQMMQGVTIKVNPTGETKTIDSWKCDGYDVNMNIMMMDMKQKVWASTDVPFDWKAFNEKMLPQFTQAMMNIGGDAMDEFIKIKGFQIRTEMSMNMMGAEMKSWTEVSEIAEKSAPAGIYSVPEGYSKKDKFSMMDLQKK